MDTHSKFFEATVTIDNTIKSETNLETLESMASELEVLLGKITNRKLQVELDQRRAERDAEIARLEEEVQ